MLHIHNGDCSAEVLKQTEIQGEKLAWREALLTGPTPEGLSLDKWLELRACHLSEAYDTDLDRCRKDLARQEDLLHNCSEHEEVILWFEHDLFCQINLLYLLNRLSCLKSSKTKLSLICIGQFPGHDDFRGLGQLSPEQMASLFNTRHEVTDLEFAIATEAWNAYCSPDPKSIENLLSKDLSVLPFLKQSLISHLARFPSTRNGLGRVENIGLELVSNGFKRFVQLFQIFGSKESIYGFGDYQFWNELKRLVEAEEPLLCLEGIDNRPEDLSPGNFSSSSFKITPKGEEVLKSETDFIEINGIDLWLGGVHLKNGNTIWRWDEKRLEIISTEYRSGRQEAQKE
jgi:hypothetical protein